MKVNYHFNSFDEKRMLVAISNLLLYYVDVSVNIRERLRMLQNNERLRDVLTTHLRKGTGSMSITIDSVFNAVENSMAQGDLFWFEVDGKRFCDLLHDKKELDVKFFMNDNYFLTHTALSKFLPGKQWVGKKYPEGVEGEKLKWMDWIDENWKKDRKILNPDFVKKRLEE